jgi:hypothetical protein
MKVMRKIYDNGLHRNTAGWEDQLIDWMHEQGFWCFPEGQKEVYPIEQIVRAEEIYQKDLLGRCPDKASALDEPLGWIILIDFEKENAL